MKTTSIRSTCRWHSAPILGVVLALPTVFGCVGNPKLDDVEKAKLIKEKRLEARDMLARFKASGEKDLKFLERYAELHRENTEIAPDTCPKCWAEYGEALSMIGWKYWYDYQDVLDEIEQAERSEVRALKAEARDLEAKWMDYFTRSNRAYETHFRSTDVPAVHPYSYERVMRHNELLGNFELAYYFLDKCVESYPLLRGGMDGQTRQRFERLRIIYKQEIQKQKESEVRGRQKGPPARNPTGRRAKAAQSADEEAEE